MKGNKDILNQLQEIEFSKPSDIIIRQIKGLVSDGYLKPGDRLPSERSLSEKFGVGRGYVREALRKLEFYGILKTMPQSGTVVASLGVKILEGLISNILDLEKKDFEALVETRGILEINAARFTAQRCSDEEITELEKSLENLKTKVENGESGKEEDLLFHIKLAEFSKNTVLKSLIMLISPDILKFSEKYDTCRDGRSKIALQEHSAILQAIKNRNPDEAANAMSKHLKMTLDAK